VPCLPFALSFRHHLLFCVITCLATAISAMGQAAHPVRHTLDFQDAKHHYVHVQSVYPTDGNHELEVFLAVWTPGSYLIREYSRNIDTVSAYGPEGDRLPLVRTRKNRWKIQTQGKTSITLRYSVYCREMSVRTNFVDDSFGMIHGAATFLSPVGKNAQPHRVRVNLPSHWSRAISGMPQVGTGDSVEFHAADYDTLVDSPIVAGNPDVFEFEVAGKKHFLVNTPSSPTWDGPRSVDAVKRIVEHFSNMWGGLPYDQYVFLNMLVQAEGGLEHKNSTVIMADSLETQNEDRFRRWLDLVSHEFFHVWNIKRLRPVELGPFDYENENYTQSLWIAEGLTSYYSALALRRAGLINRQKYLDDLSNTIASVEAAQGQLLQSLADASYDAWIKYYRPNENSPHTTVSYYSKGALVGFLLDARIRRATNGAKSLDDLMRLAYSRYSGERGFAPQEFIRCVQDIAGQEVANWLTQTTQNPGALNYDDALDYYGLRFRPAASLAPTKGWLGAEVRSNGVSMVVTSVAPETPAHSAGLNVDDEILAIANRRITPALWPQLGDYYPPRAQAILTISRRGEILNLPVTFGVQPQKSWRIELRPDATETQRRALFQWLAEQ
jgi:predicted metalloprotease with PDZ domain